MRMLVKERGVRVVAGWCQRFQEKKKKKKRRRRQMREREREKRRWRLQERKKM
jgi:hypothetical protein